MHWCVWFVCLSFSLSQIQPKAGDRHFYSYNIFLNLLKLLFLFFCTCPDGVELMYLATTGMYVPTNTIDKS